MTSNKRRKILATGGAGYIGCHAAIQLINAGYDVVIFDNFSNSKIQVISQIEAITGCCPTVVDADIRDHKLVRKVFENHNIDAVIHFAGLKAVGDSQSNPLAYYDNNVNGSLILLQEMQKAKVKTIVFSSSATVYGAPGFTRYNEETELRPINVYGSTKLVVENILRDLKKSDDDWGIGILRYFNPVGAHVSGLIGEDPNGVPNNLMPLVAQVASGRRKCVNVFGGDYATTDGTACRDYIHIEDLVAGHLAVLNKLFLSPELLTFNLGTGVAYSVLDVINAFRKASNRNISHKIVGRRDGDLAEYFADPRQAELLLGWHAKKGLREMCEDVWRWESNNCRV